MKLSNSFEIFNQPIYNYQFLFFVFKSQKMSRGFSRKKEAGARKNRALPGTVGAKLPPPQRIFPNRPVTYYYVAWNARTKCRTPLTYVSRTYLCMYAHQAPGGLSTLSLSPLLSPSPVPRRCDTKQQFKFPSSVEIVRHVTSRINTLKGRHIN